LRTKRSSHQRPGLRAAPIAHDPDQIDFHEQRDVTALSVGLRIEHVRHTAGLRERLQFRRMLVQQEAELGSVLTDNR